MQLTGLLTALYGITLVSQATAFFRVTCAPWKRERLDPLVDRGVESSHMHTFWGSREVGPDTVTGLGFRDGCTSCDNQLDKSAYWMPTLYYVKKNATVPVKVSIFHVYYQGQENEPGLYPEDFALIGGNPKITEDEIRAQGGNGIHWHFEESDEVKENWQFPKKRGKGWLRGNVPFPGWVVKDESLGRYRKCNDTVDTGCISVPGMFFAVWYDVGDEDFFTFTDGDYLTLSSGGGHTYHGDFIMGWDKSALYEVSRNTTEFAKIGGDEAYVLSDKCNATAEATTYLWDLDYEAVLAAKNGSLAESVVTGTYGKYLAISDGRSVNATWSGEWGKEGVPVAESVDETAPESSASLSGSSTLAPASVGGGSSTETLPATSLVSAQETEAETAIATASSTKIEQSSPSHGRKAKGTGRVSCPARRRRLG